MDVPPSKNVQASPTIARPRTLSRSSFLYPSDIKESATTEILGYSLKAGRRVRHSIGYSGEKSNLAYKVVRSPYSLESKENRCVVKGAHKRKASQEVQLKECSSPLKSEQNSKENDCLEEYNRRSPILQSRRFRRKAMKKSRSSSSSKQNTDSFQQRISNVTINTNCIASKPSVGEAEPKADSEHNSNDLSSIDFSKIFSECFTQDVTAPNTTQTKCGLSEMKEIAPLVSNNDAAPVQTNARNTVLANRGLSEIDKVAPPISNRHTNNTDDLVAPVEINAMTTTRTNCDLSEIQNIAPAISDNDANNTFDSMFSCTDEELLACVCDDIANPKPLDTTSKQRSGNSSSVDTLTDLPSKPHFESIQFCGNDNIAPVFGFQTASKKEIKVSKTALQKAENILHFDCFGDPL